MNWKKFFKGTALLFLFNLPAPLFSCGYDYDPSSEYYSFFHSTYWVESPYEGLLYSPVGPLSINYGFDDPNIKEWQNYFAANVTDNDIHQVVYKADRSSLEYIKSQIKKKQNFKLTEEYNSNSIINLWRNKEKLDALDYLIFAKACEEANYKPEYSWYDDEETDDDKNTQLQKELLKDGPKLIKSRTSKFFKERYGFQLVRLAHYTDDFNQAVAFYDKYFEENKSPSYIQLRALEQKAGALTGLNHPQAPLLFAKVFAALPDRRETCLRSFMFQNLEAVDQSLSENATIEEKSTYMMLRAFAYSGLEIEELEKIVAINPTYSFLPVLVLRQISHLEQEALNVNNANIPNLTSSKKVLERLLTVCEKLKKSGEESQRQLYETSIAYLYFLNSDWEAANQASIALQKKYKDNSSQTDILSYLLAICQTKEWSRDTEDQFYIQFLENENLKECTALDLFIHNTYSRKFKQNKEYGKAFLAVGYPSLLESNLNPEIVKRVYDLHQKPNKTSYEKYLAGQLNLNTLKEYMGSTYMQRNQLDSALWWFNQMERYSLSANYNENEQVNPALFGGAIRHRFDTPFDTQCDTLYQQVKWLHRAYTKKDLCEELLHLEKLAKQNPSQAALYYYLLGNAWNNMSPYGYYRGVMYHHSGGWFDSGYDINQEDEQPADQFNGFEDLYHYEPQIAAQYFKKALSHQPNAELKARINFMYAKTLLYSYNEFGASIYYWQAPNIDYNNEFGEAYDTFEKNNQNTAFYQEVLAECGYFRTYLKTKNE